MDILFANNAKTLIASAPLLIGALTVDVDDASLFPAPTGGQFFYATIQNPLDDTDFEIVKCTSVAINTITIQRAQESTSAQEWAADSLFELRFTSGSITEIAAHEADHLSGGAAEIDGDMLDIDWNPSNYTPDATPEEATSVDHLTAHLYGIDQRVAAASESSRGTVELATVAEGKTGTDLTRVVSVAVLEAVLKQQSWIQSDGYYIGTDKVRARDGDGLDLEDDGGNGIHIADGGGVSFDAGVRFNRVAVSDADRTNAALSTDHIVAFTALTAGRAYQISSADIALSGRIFIVKDEAGAAGTYNITISTQGSEKIDGQDTYVIKNNYGAVTLYSNGSHLFIY